MIDYVDGDHRQIIKCLQDQVEYLLEKSRIYEEIAGLGGKMVKPYDQDSNGEIQEISFLGGLLHGYRRVPAAA